MGFPASTLTLQAAWDDFRQAAEADAFIATVD